MEKISKKRINNCLSENSSLTTTNLLYESLVLSACLPACYLCVHVLCMYGSSSSAIHLRTPSKRHGDLIAGMFGK